MGTKYFYVGLATLVSLSFTSILGCDKVFKSDDSRGYPVYEVPGPLETRLREAPLNCSSSVCNEPIESIGMISFIVEGSSDDSQLKVGQCTGFLFGSNDLVATNAHCISDILKNNKDLCSKYMGIKFPAANGKGEEVRMCESLIFHSSTSKKEGKLTQDYAFFRIKPVGRTPLKVSYESIPEKMEISALKINPLGSRLGGWYEKVLCRTVMNSLLNEDYKSPLSETALAMQIDQNADAQACKIVQGNSGSPVLNMANDVVGTLHSFYEDTLRQKLGSKEFLEDAGLGFLQINVPTKTPNHFHFTPTACMAIADLKIKNHADCVYSSSKKSEAGEFEKKTYSAISEADKLKFEQAFLSELPEIVRFELDKSKPFEVKALPKCLISKDRWNDSHQEKFRLGSNQFIYSKVPAVGRAKTVITTDWRMVPTSTTVEPEFGYVKATVEFSEESAEYRIDRNFNFSAAFNGYFDKQRFPISAALSWCD